jgi:hypothetical protein
MKLTDRIFIHGLWQSRIFKSSNKIVDVVTGKQIANTRDLG